MHLLIQNTIQRTLLYVELYNSLPCARHFGNIHNSLLKCRIWSLSYEIFTFLLLVLHWHKQKDWSFRFPDKKFEAWLVWVLLQLLCSTNSCKEKCLIWFHTLFLSLDYSFWMQMTFFFMWNYWKRMKADVKMSCLEKLYFFKVFTWMCIKQNSFKPHFSHPFHQIAFSAVFLLSSNFIQHIWNWGKNCSFLLSAIPFPKNLLLIGIIMPTLSAQVQISFAMHGPEGDKMQMLCDWEMGLYIRTGRGIIQTGHNGKRK